MRDIGFTLVALWTAFVIILVLDLRAPIWLILLCGALATAIGHRFVRTVEADTTSRPRPAEQARCWSARTAGHDRQVIAL